MLSHRIFRDNYIPDMQNSELSSIQQGNYGYSTDMACLCCLSSPFSIDFTQVVYVLCSHSFDDEKLGISQAFSHTINCAFCLLCFIRKNDFLSSIHILFFCYSLHLIVCVCPPIWSHISFCFIGKIGILIDLPRIKMRKRNPFLLNTQDIRDFSLIVPG